MTNETTTPEGADPVTETPVAATVAAEAVQVATAAAQEETAAQIECPFCAEMINARAKKCRFCGEVLDPALRKAEEAMRHAQASPQVFMNSGGGGGGGAAAAAVSAGPALYQLRPWGHGVHIILSVLTMGMWVPVWVLLYVLRNRAIYF